MVDPRAQVIDLFVVRLDPICQHHRRALHRVAQPGDRDKCLSLQRPAQHRHRVGIVEQRRPGAVALHIADDVHHRREGAQESEDAAGSARIAHVDIHSVFLGDLDIVPPDFGAAGQDGGQHHVRIPQRFHSVQRGAHRCGIFSGFDQFLHRFERIIQPLRIDIHQRDVGIRKQREGEDIPHQSLGKPQAACSDKRDFCHGSTPY